MSFLDDMIARRRASVAAGLGQAARSDIERRTGLLRVPVDFVAALRDRPDVAIIAEVKKASPSLGPIAPGCDAAAQAFAYERGGAAAVSVLTEPDVFGGSFSDLAAVASAVRLPVLCKDFVVDHAQLAAAHECGADAVLLMACVLGDELGGYIKHATMLGLAPLVEVASPMELAAVLAEGATLIAVNARDFTTLEVTLLRQRTLVTEAARAGALVVAASGITRREDVEAAVRAGASAVLVGETLMRAPVPEDVLAVLTTVGKEQGND